MSHLIAWFLWGIMEGDDDDRDKDILITGSLPKYGKGASENRAAAMREGMGAFRIKLFGQTFDYGRLDPVATTLGTTTDLIREFKKSRRGEKDAAEIGVTLLADTIVGQMTDKTMLRGINDNFMMASGKLPLDKWAARQLANMLVPNIIRQPIRDTNPYYDANIDINGVGGFLEAVFYESLPNSVDKLGGLLPANPKAPPAARDAYGEKTKRPKTWLTRKQTYTPNRLDNIIRRDQKMNPGDDIKMPGKMSNSYTYTDPETGKKEKHKFTKDQYGIVQRLYRTFLRQERTYVTDGKGVTDAKEKAGKMARSTALKNPKFLLEAKKNSAKLK
jgi:hypothetical protein